jgi:hypothetical protein
MADFYESREWLELRYRVLKKADGSCKLCGCRASPGNPLQVDHIKPRSTHPHLALSEGNMQVLCKGCNLGKSNKDTTDWRVHASRELTGLMAHRSAVLDHATPLQKAKLEQLSWLRKNDPDKQIRKEAEKQYKLLWEAVEMDWAINN